MVNFVWELKVCESAVCFLLTLFFLKTLLYTVRFRITTLHSHYEGVNEKWNTWNCLWENKYSISLVSVVCRLNRVACNGHTWLRWGSRCGSVLVLVAGWPEVLLAPWNVWGNKYWKSRRNQRGRLWWDDCLSSVAKPIISQTHICPGIPWSFGSEKKIETFV